MPHVKIEAGTYGTKVIARLTPLEQFDGNGPWSRLRHDFRRQDRQNLPHPVPKHPNPQGLVARILPLDRRYSFREAEECCAAVNATIGDSRFQALDGLIIDRDPLSLPEGAAYACLRMLTGQSDFD